jgi:uncharacterized repeat protein (TIGR03803 family)
MPRPCPSALVAKNPVQSIVILGPQHSIMTKLCFTYSSILAIVFLTLMLSGPEAIAQVLTTAYTFPTSGPAAGLIFDRSGNLYGTLVNDGPFGCGSVFELSPATGGGWTQTTLYTFTGGSDGCFPETTLTFDTAGNLFGTTQGDGGLIDDGSVFELSPTSGGGWVENTLRTLSLSGPEGGKPLTAVIFDQSVNLYGTTHLGGPCGSGTVFELTPTGFGTWSEQILHCFGSGTDGKKPDRGLVFNQSGKLYGTTSEGGTANRGIVFELVPQADGTWTENVIFNFILGGKPVLGALILDTSGNLYGVSPFGGTFSPGAAWELVLGSDGTWTRKVLYSFHGYPNDAWHPAAPLLFDKGKYLYGSSHYGGTNDCGVIFRLAQNTDGTWGETRYNLAGSGSCRPNPGLVFDQHGNIYGTTGVEVGTVFEFTP